MFSEFSIIPFTTKPSPVKVPVLSKTQQLPPPAELIFVGLIQKTLHLFFNLLIEKVMATDRVAGRPGGTTIVTMSSARTIISFVGRCNLLKLIAEIMKPKRAKRVM